MSRPFSWLTLPIKPCPFCDATGAHLWPISHASGAIIIYCGSCGAAGPRFIKEWRKFRPDDRQTVDVTEAITAWNRRRPIKWSEWHELQPNGHDDKKEVDPDDQE